jgi:hypothetical protein
VSIVEDGIDPVVNHRDPPEPVEIQTRAARAVSNILQRVSAREGQSMHQRIGGQRAHRAEQQRENNRGSPAA